MSVTAYILSKQSNLDRACLSGAPCLSAKLNSSVAEGFGSASMGVQKNTKPKESVVSPNFPDKLNLNESMMVDQT